MEPVEINAGNHYLRQLRADDRIDDRPALVSAFADVELRHWITTHRLDDEETAGRYVARRAEEWASDQRCSWAIAEPLTGELVGEIGLARLDLAGGTAEAACWVAAGWRGKGIATEALGAALRFGRGALGLTRIDYRHAPDNLASERVASRCGLDRIGPIGDVILWRTPAPVPG
jgi:RimJ/RimL family protein N-acetyltransferase